MALRTLSLCTGIGGLDLAVRRVLPHARAVGYVERDAFAAATLVARMEEAALDRAPVWDDLATFPCDAFRGCVDLVVAGFPCQPVSVAGKRRAQEDERWLWPLVARVIREVGCGLVFLENVPGILSAGALDVLRDLAGLGFDAQWSTLRAADVGAPHRRRRFFLLGYRDLGLLERDVPEPKGVLGWRGAHLADADGVELRRQPGRGSRAGRAGAPEPAVAREDLADPDREGRGHERGGGLLDGLGPALGDDPVGRFPHVGHAHGEGLEGLTPDAWDEGSIPPWPPSPTGDWSMVPRELWPVEPKLRGVAHGLPHRLDRLRTLGNAVVPAQAALALRNLIWRAQHD